MIGIAATGSGKTLGFTLPMLKYLLQQPKLGKKLGQAGPYSLILAPTRELAMQIVEVCKQVLSPFKFNCVGIYGGVDKYPQISALKKGVHTIVATPGRLLSLERDYLCSLKQVQYLVLDEADRMLDMGFEPDIRKIISMIHPKHNRQTLLFSATWPESIQRLGKEFVNNPIHITIGDVELKASNSITQVVEVIEDSIQLKNKKLLTLLKQYHAKKNERIIIFVLYKKEVPRVERFLKQRGYNCIGTSSDKTQQERNEALDAFKNGTIPLLIATDVAARGLDVDDVKMVINYSFPLTVEDYVHRIGRTGRGGATGRAHTFFTPFSKALAGALCHVLEKANAKVPAELKKFGVTITKQKADPIYGGHYRRKISAEQMNTKPKRIILD